MPRLSQALDEQFQLLHNSYLSHHSFDWDDLKEASFEYFDRDFRDHSGYDDYFNTFISTWQVLMAHGLNEQAQELWRKSLEIAHEWEEENDRIHKGTPYYFWGMTAILNGEIEKGFLLMHNALEEDITTHDTRNPNLPARHFVLLDPDERKQAFYQKVDQMGNFLEGYLEDYQNRRSGNLDFSEFRSRFLEKPDLQETAFSFVYNLFRLEKLVNGTSQIPHSNTFGSLHQADLFFGFCRTLENLFEYELPNGVTEDGSLKNYIEYFSSNCAVSLGLNINDRLGDVNDDQKDDFEATVGDLLQDHYTFEDDTAPDQIEADLCLAYCFRNFGAHTIDDYEVIYEYSEEISRRILNSLFFTIETLYT